jgi:sulfur-oxidizing protein SoxY
MFDSCVTPGNAPSAARTRDTAMSGGRRELLRWGGKLAALAITGLLPGGWAFAAKDGVRPGAGSMSDALSAWGSVPASASQILLKIPEVAENGAAVPVSVESSLPGPLEILILVESNPIPLAARFTIPEGTDPFVSLRIKLAESSRVHAVVRAGGRVYATARETQVTVGGCG